MLLTLLHQADAAGGGAALSYAASVALAALVSLLSRSSQRRRDARETLKILLRRKPCPTSPPTPTISAHETRQIDLDTDTQHDR